MSIATDKQIHFITSLITQIRALTTDEVTGAAVAQSFAAKAEVLARHMGGEAIDKSEAAALISTLINTRDNVCPKPALNADLVALADAGRALKGNSFAAKMVAIVDAGKVLTPNQEAALRRCVESAPPAGPTGETVVKDDDGYVPRKGDVHVLPNGDVCRVKISQVGRPYVLVGAGAGRYERGLIASCNLATLATAEQAKAHGMETGWCICCGADLTDPVSVANGIGPVCASKRGW